VRLSAPARVRLREQRRTEHADELARRAESRPNSTVEVRYDPAEPANADAKQSHKLSLWMLTGLVYVGPIVGLVLVLSNLG
jgi:hypothetical protein